MSDYTRVELNGQLAMCASSSEIIFPCCLDGFIYKDTRVHIDETGLPHMEFIGEQKVSYEDCFCPKCGRKMSCHEHIKKFRFMKSPGYEDLMRQAAGKLACERCLYN